MFKNVTLLISVKITLIYGKGEDREITNYFHISGGVLASLFHKTVLWRLGRWIWPRIFAVQAGGPEFKSPTLI